MLVGCMLANRKKYSEKVAITAVGARKMERLLEMTGCKKGGEVARNHHV